MTSGALRTNNPVEPQNPMRYKERARRTATYYISNRYATTLSARKPSNDGIYRSSRPLVAAVNNQPVQLDSISNDAAEVADLRHLLRGAHEPLFLLTTRKSSTPLDTTPETLHRPGVAPPRYFEAEYQSAPLLLVVIRNRTATTPGHVGCRCCVEVLGTDNGTTATTGTRCLL